MNTAKDDKQAAAEVLTQAPVLPLNTDFEIITKNDHKSGKGIYAHSKAVKSYKEVKEVAERMKNWLNHNNGRFHNTYKTAYAVSHCQVSEVPFAFFVVAQELCMNNDIAIKGETKTMNKRNYYFPSQIIINAEILEAPEKIPATVPKRELVKTPNGVETKIRLVEGMSSNKIFVPDGCMSFPLRKAKNVERFYRIKVRYQIKGLLGLKTITEEVEGLKAHIFQHEIDHAHAKNIYYGNDKK